MECPNFYQKMAHMEQLSRVGSVVESNFSRNNAKSDFLAPKVSNHYRGDLRFRHSNVDCRRSLTPQESLVSRMRGQNGLTMGGMGIIGLQGSNERMFGDSDHNYNGGSIVQNLTAFNINSVTHQMGSGGAPLGGPLIMNTLQ